MVIEPEYVCDWCGDEVLGLQPCYCDVCGAFLCPRCADDGCCDEIMRSANEEKNYGVDR